LDRVSGEKTMSILSELWRSAETKWRFALLIAVAISLLAVIQWVSRDTEIVPVLHVLL
jgi:hypothetical protein